MLPGVRQAQIEKFARIAVDAAVCGRMPVLVTRPFGMGALATLREINADQAEIIEINTREEMNDLNVHWNEIENHAVLIVLVGDPFHPVGQIPESIYNRCVLEVRL